MLSKVNMSIKDDTVQGFWNMLENKILDFVDILVPMSNKSPDFSSSSIPKIIQCNINNRRYLFQKKIKMNRNPLTKNKIKELNT